MGEMIDVPNGAIASACVTGKPKPIGLIGGRSAVNVTKRACAPIQRRRMRRLLQLRLRRCGARLKLNDKLASA